MRRLANAKRPALGPVTHEAYVVGLNGVASAAYVSARRGAQAFSLVGNDQDFAARPLGEAQRGQFASPYRETTHSEPPIAIRSSSNATKTSGTPNAFTSRVRA